MKQFEWFNCCKSIAGLCIRGSSNGADYGIWWCKRMKFSKVLKTTPGLPLLCKVICRTLGFNSHRPVRQLFANDGLFGDAPERGD